MTDMVFTLENGTEISREILNAIDKDRLVIFVGAGASCGSPTNLPTFEQLVFEVCENAKQIGFFTAEGKRAPGYENESIDSILGRIQDAMGESGNTLHDEINRVLIRSTEINDTHRAIINLASTCQTFRIVTTNQDTLLEHVSLWPDRTPVVFSAPALPLGDDFEGIVNLHGSIREVKKMIFSDRDFGEAYLTKQYCSRFLTELFSEHTVLFVGYSHDDPLMKYHARGLGSCRRFVITDKPEKASWSILEIEPIPYPLDRHQEVPIILNGIARYSMRSKDEKLALIKQIALSEPETMTGHDKSLIHECFNEAMNEELDYLVVFTNHANSYQWCNYFEKDNHAGLFDAYVEVFQSGYYSTPTNHLAEWFVKVCFKVEDLSALSYGLQKMGQTQWVWNDSFWHRVLRVLADIETPEASIGSLIPLCASRLQGYSLSEGHSELSYRFNPGDYINHGIEIEKHGVLFYSILSKITEPLVTIKRNYFAELSGDSLEVEHDIRFPASDDYISGDISEWWGDGSDYVNRYSELLNILMRNIENYCQLITTSSSRVYFDRESYSVENLIRGTFSEFGNHSVLKIVRDILINGANDVRESFLTRYQNSKDSLLIRLCMVAIENSLEKKAEQRISWLLDKDLLLPEEGNLYVSHDVSEMLRSNLPSAPDDILPRLLGYVQDKEGWRDVTGKISTWKQFELLCRIMAVRPAWHNELQPLIDRYKQDDRWSEDQELHARQEEFVSVPQAPPAVEASDFIREFRHDSHEAIQSLFEMTTEYEKEWGREEFYARNPKYLTIREAIRQDDAIVLDLWDREFDPAGKMPDLAKFRICLLFMCEEIQNYSKSSDLVQRIDQMLTDGQISESDLSQIFRYFQHAIAARDDSLTSDETTAIQAFCANCWDSFHSGFVFTSINENPILSTSGQWPWEMVSTVLSLLHDFQDINAENRIPNDLKTLIDTFISGDSEASMCAVARIYTALGFLYHKDLVYGKEVLLPMLGREIGKQNTTWFAWLGFLGNQQFNSDMLENGLLESILKIQETSCQVFGGHKLLEWYQVLLFKTLSSYELSPDIRIEVLVRISNHEGFSLEILKHALSFLRQEKGQIESVWDKWLGEYVFDRLNNRPNKLTSNEFVAIINIALYPSTKLGVLCHAIIESSQVVEFRPESKSMISLYHPFFEKIEQEGQKSFISLLCYILTHRQGQLNYSFLRNLAIVYSNASDEGQKQIACACERSGVIMPTI